MHVDRLPAWRWWPPASNVGESLPLRDGVGTGGDIYPRLPSPTRGRHINFATLPGDVAENSGKKRPGPARRAASYGDARRPEKGMAALNRASRHAPLGAALWAKRKRQEDSGSGITWQWFMRRK